MERKFDRLSINVEQLSGFQKWQDQDGSQWVGAKVVDSRMVPGKKGTWLPLTIIWKDSEYGYGFLCETGMKEENLPIIGNVKKPPEEQGLPQSSHVTQPAAQPTPTTPKPPTAPSGTSQAARNAIEQANAENATKPQINDLPF